MIALEQANRIIAEILAEGRRLGCRPLAAVVVEPGGGREGAVVLRAENRHRMGRQHP